MPYGAAPNSNRRGMFGRRPSLSTGPVVRCPVIVPGTIGTTTEAGNAMDRPGWQVIDAYRSSRKSRAEAFANFPREERHNGPGDAWRHFRWNFSMAKSMGARAAQAFANAHEVSTPNAPAELAMDLHNNAMGRAFGVNADYAGLSPAEAADLAYRSGCLQLWDSPETRDSLATSSSPTRSRRAIR